MAWTTDRVKRLSEEFNDFDDFARTRVYELLPEGWYIDSFELRDDDVAVLARDDWGDSTWFSVAYSNLVSQPLDWNRYVVEHHAHRDNKAFDRAVHRKEMDEKAERLHLARLKEKYETV